MFSWFGSSEPKFEREPDRWEPNVRSCSQALSSRSAQGLVKYDPQTHPFPPGRHSRYRTMLRDPPLSRSLPCPGFPGLQRGVRDGDKFSLLHWFYSTGSCVAVLRIHEHCAWATAFSRLHGLHFPRSNRTGIHHHGRPSPLQNSSTLLQPHPNFKYPCRERGPPLPWSLSGTRNRADRRDSCLSETTNCSIS